MLFDNFSFLYRTKQKKRIRKRDKDNKNLEYKLESHMVLLCRVLLRHPVPHVGGQRQRQPLDVHGDARVVHVLEAVVAHGAERGPEVELGPRGRQLGLLVQGGAGPGRAGGPSAGDGAGAQHAVALTWLKTYNNLFLFFTFFYFSTR